MNVAVIVINYTIIGFKGRDINTKSKARLKVKDIVPIEKLSVGVGMTNIDVKEEVAEGVTDNINEPKEVVVDRDDIGVNFQ